MQRSHLCLWQTFSAVYPAPVTSLFLKTEPQFVQLVGGDPLTSGRVGFYCRTQERNSDWSKLVIVVSFPLASNWSKDRKVAQLWSMRCNHKFDREGDPFQTKSHKSAQNGDAMLEVWHPFCNFNDKSQHWGSRVESQVKFLMTLSFSLSGPPNSRLIIRWKKLITIYLGHYQSGFRLLIAVSLPDTHICTPIFCFLRKDQEKSHSLLCYFAYSRLTAGSQFHWLTHSKNCFVAVV